MRAGDTSTCSDMREPCLVSALLFLWAEHRQSQRTGLRQNMVLRRNAALEHQTEAPSRMLPGSHRLFSWPTTWPTTPRSMAPSTF